jgi:HK97 family phage portal protein
VSILQLNLPTPPSGKLALSSERGAIAGLSELFMGVRSRSGQFVNSQTALRASAVLACIRILTEDISALPLNLFRRTPQGSTLATDLPLFRLLHDIPNEWQTSFDWREGMLLDLLLHGKCFTEKVISRDGIESLVPLQAARMLYLTPQPDFLPPGAPIVWLYSSPRETRPLFDDQIFRVSTLAESATVEGRAITLLAREAIGLLLAAEDQGARLFSHGLQTDVVIKTQDALGDNQKNQLRESLQQMHQGSENAFRPLLLEGGIDIAKIGLTAQESQYLEARAFQTADIARIFRIPDVLLGISNGKTATFASAEQFFDSYTKFTLQPWLRRIEQAAYRDLLSTEEQSTLFIRHDLDSLTRADLETRYAAHSVGISSGFLTRNEARKMENLPTLPGLDEPLQPLNMGSGNPNANVLAGQLAKNCVAHETKLLSDGKSRADVYAKLLPGYLRDKAGLSLAKCTEYCSARLAGASDTSDGVELLTKLLIAG